MAGTDQHKLTGPEYQDARTKEIHPAATPDQPYNILLINADTYRYDNLFDRAAIPVATPNLDAFAGRAVSMSSFYTGSFPTIPERTDLISGRYAWPWVPWQQFAEQNLMPQLLNRHGYVTQLICDCPHLFNAGFNRTFNGAFQVRGQEGDIGLLHMNDPIVPIMPREKTRTGHHFQDRNLVDLHRWTNRYPTCEEETFPYARPVTWCGGWRRTTATVLSCSGSTSSIPTSRGTRRSTWCEGTTRTTPERRCCTPTTGAPMTTARRSCATCGRTIAPRLSWSTVGSGASSRNSTTLSCGTTLSLSSPPTMV